MLYEVITQDPVLYADIQKYNPYAKQVSQVYHLANDAARRDDLVAPLDLLELLPVLLFLLDLA